MADGHTSDHILFNILARLPAKPLIRFTCVSKHWNCLIKDPYLMKLRSRRPMILLSNKISLVAIDDNVHNGDTTNSVVEVSSPFGPVTIVGTFNGIVLLLHNKHSRYQLILYNPFTRVFKTYPTSVPWEYYHSNYKFGLGSGATMGDLKFVRLGCSYGHQIKDCDVFSFRKNSWENIKQSNIQGIKFRYRDMGKFLNGILYWIGNYNRDDKLVIVALSFKDMVLSTINPPDQFTYNLTPLGTIDGCLCMIDKCSDMEFNVWMMKEQDVENSWMKRWSFTLHLEGNCFTTLFPICILDSGKIMFRNRYHQLIIYCTSNASLKNLNPPKGLKGLNTRALCKQDGIEYMESLVSPSDLCFVLHRHLLSYLFDLLNFYVNPFKDLDTKSF